VVQVRLPSVILPVVGVDAEGLVVLGEVERTPDCFEVEHVEILVVLVVMDQLDDDVVLAVGEGAERSVLALFEVVGIEGAELGFVLFGAI